MSFSIRLATGGDSLAAAAVVQAVFSEYGFTWEAEGYHADLYDLDRYYLAVGDPFWVAEREGVIVGTCALELFDPLPGKVGEVAIVDGKVRAGGADCSLERLYVHPTARRMGIGAALFETTLAEARQRGRQAMEIWSDKEFGDAHRLYERYGAVVIGDRICDDPDEAAEWGLVLPLSAPCG